MTLARHLCLVGLPGAGKSTVGRALAERLGCAFADSDEEVEREAGASIADIFERLGEAEFRRLERAAIMRLLQRSPLVIALGGGAFDDPSTRGTLLASAVVAWLDVPQDVIVERLSADGVRPLFDGHEVALRLAELAAKRLPHYRQAQLHIEAATSAAMTEAIVSALQSDIAARSARR